MLLIIVINKIQEFCINLFGKLLDILPKKSIFQKTFDSEVWLTDEKSKPQQIKVKINITLFTN